MTVVNLGDGWNNWFFKEITKSLKRNRSIYQESDRKQKTLIQYRRSFQAWRDRSRIFISAREGRLMELRFRLRWGKLAGGLSLKGMCDGALMTPLEAARKRDHRDCIELLVKESFEA